MERRPCLATALLVLITNWCTVTSLNLVNNKIQLELELKDVGIPFVFKLDDETKLSGQLGERSTVELPEDCDGASSCFLEGDYVSLNITSIDSGFLLSWQSADIETTFTDCLDLNIGDINWYGGPQKWNEEWPIENVKYDNRAYVSVNEDHGGVSERYWLNSRGSYVFVEDRVPLFIDQNNLKSGSLCMLAKVSDPYFRRERNILEYYLVAKGDAKEAHLHAVNNFLGKPSGYPDEWVIRNPIWTTWAKYKKAISDDIVVAFAKDISDHGFTGQIEIDDYWETCYGSMIFNEDQFSKINSTVQSVKDLGFTVSLWSHPYVNDECQDQTTYGQENDLFVKSVDGNDITSWWDGNTARYIDFTKQEGADWFTDRLKLLQEKHGIDSFKFDSGESSCPPSNGIVNGDIELAPNIFTSSYVRTCATFGGAIEVRVGWRTQDLPVLMRMTDKDSIWGLDNGLHSLITTLLVLNINGYPMVLPDMIGGNGYGDLPTPELLARWTQANTFMPSMQFSYLPWDITSDDFDGEEIIKKYVTLHEEYSDQIIESMEDSINNGTPVNPPVWWVDPSNSDLWAINDEYLLGEKILVAPVIEEGTVTRNIVLPSGSWKDGNTGEVYEGPQVLTDYPAPIDILPFFVKQL